MVATRAAFLDANVLRGQLTNDIMMTLAHERLYVPQWSAEVLAEAGRNRPQRVGEEAINSRFAQMNRVFPAAMTIGYEPLMPQMQADDKDRHVLAAAVHGGSDVLVTENTKDFHPPASGPHAMKVERTSQFLNRLLEDHPREVVGALQKMVDRNRRTPQTMPELIDKMVT
ncbi:PIN domain-containing protein [Kribbella sp. NPDC023855]|uniref:PIN domain-containing protein n=1 Tax=Kribbella sp. NPDC023855 TaxID=3154698 RepID=UPI0033EF05DE